MSSLQVDFAKDFLVRLSVNLGKVIIFVTFDVLKNKLRISIPLFVKKKFHLQYFVIFSADSIHFSQIYFCMFHIDDIINVFISFLMKERFITGL